MASREIVLNCLLYGDEPEDDRVFPICIASTRHVLALKYAIKAERAVDLAHIDAANLQIWKVLIPFDDSQFNTRVKEYAFENENHARAVKKLSSVFDDPLDEHLHILVRGHEVSVALGPQPVVEAAVLEPQPVVEDYRLDGPTMQKRQQLTILAIQSLAEHYQDLKLGDIDTTFARFFSYIRSYPVPDNGFVDFHYLEKLAPSSLTKPVYKALTDKKESIVVKFTRRYNTDAHRLLASKGLAPRLLYSGFDTGNTHGSCGSLKMVVMDFAEGSTAYDIDAPLSVKQYEHVQNAVKILHDEGFVFGDLRLPNIMVDGETAKLIDFDWCAKEGTGRYPAVINDADIKWHTGVEGGGKMKKEHDDFMLLEGNMPHLLQ